MADLVALSDVSKIFSMGEDVVHALSSVSITIEAGEYIALMGASGSGKSTLMNIIGCLDAPSSGSYRFDGSDTASLDDRDLALIRSTRIGFVFQNFNLLPRISALENVARPLVYQRMKHADRMAYASHALDRVALGHRKDHLPSQLSGGQRQRVAIARAICSRPSLLIADEPTGNLDSTTTDEILSLFEELHRGGMTIVVVTHESEVARRSERLISLLDGRVTSDVRR